jgi:predicted AAA+ superfamily ATPase
MSAQFPVVFLTGPRQSGKTTLVKMAFPDHLYVSLEEGCYKSHDNNILILDMRRKYL